MLNFTNWTKEESAEYSKQYVIDDSLKKTLKRWGRRSNPFFKPNDVQEYLHMMSDNAAQTVSHPRILNFLGFVLQESLSEYGINSAPVPLEIKASVKSFWDGIKVKPNEKALYLDQIRLVYNLGLQAGIKRDKQTGTSIYTTNGVPNYTWIGKIDELTKTAEKIPKLMKDEFLLTVNDGGFVIPDRVPPKALDKITADAIQKGKAARHAESRMAIGFGSFLVEMAARYSGGLHDNSISPVQAVRYTIEKQLCEMAKKAFLKKEDKEVSIEMTATPDFSHETITNNTHEEPTYIPENSDFHGTTEHYEPDVEQTMNESVQEPEENMPPPADMNWLETPVRPPPQKPRDPNEQFTSQKPSVEQEIFENKADLPPPDLDWLPEQAKNDEIVTFDDEMPQPSDMKDAKKENTSLDNRRVS